MKTRSFALLVVALTIAGCQDGEGSGERITIGGPGQAAQSTLPADVQAAIDGGNAAFRAGDHAAALAHYREATRLGPDQGSAWFGVAMAAGALGDQALADSAQARVRELSPELGSASHGGPGSPGHP
jgi:tetratricopeptide (TPR) repeat protein